MSAFLTWQLAIEASDAGEPTKKVLEWAERHAVQTVFSVGRDMGAAPPRQTELRLKLPGTDFNAQLAVSTCLYCFFLTTTGRY